jgi:hypothetical protein
LNSPPHTTAGLQLLSDLAAFFTHQTTAPFFRQLSLYFLTAGNPGLTLNYLLRHSDRLRLQALMIPPSIK